MADRRVQVAYYGRVQGVGFRYTAERLAHVYKVSGYVKNLADGSVAVVAEGDEKILNDFLKALYQQMEPLIDKQSVNWFPATGEPGTFEIRF